MADEDHVFQRLCSEAVTACGDDIAAIERYVQARIEQLDDRRRGTVARDLGRIFDFQAPDRSSTSH